MTAFEGVAVRVREAAILDEPRYSVAEAARLSGVDPAALRRWANALFPGSSDRQLSFLELVELALLRTLASETHLSLPHVAALSATWNRAAGRRHASLARDSRALGDMSLPPRVSRFLANFDYGERYARAWWPRGRDAGVVVDPALGFGLAVVGGSGIRTEILLERFRAGDSVDEIARDFNLSRAEVERALRFEACLGAA